MVSEGKTDEAHATAAFGFQLEQNTALFSQTAKELGLVGSSGLELETVAEEPREAKFNARVTTADAQKRTYIATMQNDRGTWRLFSLRTPKRADTGRAENHFSLVGKGAAFGDALNQPIPDEATVQRMIQQTLAMFNDAVQQKSFNNFYQNISTSWQSQLTERQLQRAFQPFMDQEINIGGALNLKPVLDTAPQISTEGLLLVSGHLPSKPYQVEFSLKFIYELPDWKLFGIDVNLRKAQE